MKHTFYLLTALLFLISCTSKKEIQIKGQIENADNQTLYFEMAGMTNADILDSIVLDKSGNFSFKQPASKEPSFFRLRIQNQSIQIACDSNERITINASLPNFASQYLVKGSLESEKIKTITEEGQKLKGKLRQLAQAYQSGSMNVVTYTDTVQQQLTMYKTKVLPYIFENPRSAAAYFTLFQSIDGLLIFDPNDKKDLRSYGAVATAWDSFYPKSERNDQLRNIALGAMKQQRIQNQQAQKLPDIKEQNQIEIVLPDMHGKNVQLSDLNGKVVLLDFTAYESDFSGPYNISLAKLFDKYKEKGFMIYQVSLDPNEHFWKVTASNLPWIAVRDKDSNYSKFARLYNVTQLPTAYLLDRTGGIVERVNDLKSLDSAIQKLL